MIEESFSAKDSDTKLEVLPTRRPLIFTVAFGMAATVLAATTIAGQLLSWYPSASTKVAAMLLAASLTLLIGGFYKPRRKGPQRRRRIVHSP